MARSPCGQYLALASWVLGIKKNGSEAFLSKEASVAFPGISRVVYIIQVCIQNVKFTFGQGKPSRCNAFSSIRVVDMFTGELF